MRLKIYQAPNIGAAIALIRDELGPDALILTSRAVDDGVEVTAAHEGPQPSPASPMCDAGQADWAWHGVPTTLADRLQHGDLTAKLARVFAFSVLPLAVTERPLMLVGPPGAGKTMTTARLATRLKLAGNDAHVITADGRRAGAAEQLAAFTRLLGLTLIVADTPQQLARAIARRPENAPVLIDMPGLNPAVTDDRAFVSQCQTAADARLALVLPTGLDPSEAEETAIGFRELGASHLVATRMDQSARLGGILAAAATGLALSDVGIGAGVVDALETITPAFLATRLIRHKTSLPAARAPEVQTLPLVQLVRSRSEPPRAPT